jgi:hypothetical protein
MLCDHVAHSSDTSSVTRPGGKHTCMRFSLSKMRIVLWAYRSNAVMPTRRPSFEAKYRRLQKNSNFFLTPGTNHHVAAAAAATAILHRSWLSLYTRQLRATAAATNRSRDAWAYSEWPSLSRTSRRASNKRWCITHHVGWHFTYLQVSLSVGQSNISQHFEGTAP